MRQLLEAPGDAPIQVVELARVEKDGAPISASRVRNCISSASGRRLRRWCRREPSLF
jgi:citrate lyase synthetase